VKRHAAVLAVSIVLAVFPSLAASAEDSARPPSDDEQIRLERVLEWASSDALEKRWTTAVAQGVLGAATLGPGVALAAKKDSALQSVGVGFVVGGSFALLSIPLLLAPAPVERIQGHLHERLANGEDAAAVVRRVETELREAAARKRARRPCIGGVTVALGAGGLATGLVFLLARPGVGGANRQTQNIWGAALVGAGGPLLAAGLRTLLQRSPEEVAWDRFCGERREKSSQNESAISIAPSIAPTKGGAIAALRIVF